MGLLDFKMPDMDSAQGQGLLAAAFSMMGAKGNSMSEAIGDAGRQYMGTYQQARGVEDQKKLRDLQMKQAQIQMDEMQRKADMDKTMRDIAQKHMMPAIPGVAGEEQKPLNMMGDTGPSLFSRSTSNMSTPGRAAVAAKPAGFNYDGYLNDMAGIDPLKAMEERQRLIPEPKYQTVGNTLLQVGRGGVTPVFTAQEKIDVNKPFLYIDGKMVANPAYQDFALRERAAGRSVQTVKLPAQENEESKAVGKFFGENYAEVQKAGLNAQGKINRINRLDSLLTGVDTGKFAPVGVDIAKAAKEFGINIDDKLGNKEAAVALSSEIALELRNPSGGAGMPGAMSDADRNFLAGMVPGIEKTPEGRKLIVETYRKMAQRDMEVANMARKYRAKNGSINEGFYDELAAYSQANPLFTPKAPSGNASGGVKFLGFEGKN